MQRIRVFAIVFLLAAAGAAAGLFVADRDRPFQLGLDLQGGLHLVYDADLSRIALSERDQAMEGLRDVIDRRVNLFGVTEPVVQTEGSGENQRLIVELAGIVDPVRAVEIIGETPYLEFRELGTQDTVQAEQEIELDISFQPTELTGRYLESASLGFHDVTSSPIIQLQFNEEGAELFQEITARNIGQPLAIFLDGQLLSAPTVQQEISGGQAQITGVGSLEEVRRIVRNLNAGALPVPITMLSQEHVGALLGAESLAESLRAGIGGFAAVLLFMGAVYRLPGLLSALALLFYVAVLLALFKLIPVTLTLAGVAGVILSIGMAVDASILIFSRMREELKEGKEFSPALEEGFRRAWPSIRDGNSTTLLVALILFWLGSSFVKGFALTLSLGIVLSMFVALVLTKGLLRLFEGTRLARFRQLWL